MTKPTYGCISNDESYTTKEIANRLGISEAVVKAWVRAKVKYIEPFQGIVIVAGRLWNAAIEELSEHDTPEQLEERLRKSGAAKRKARKEEAAV